MRTPRFRITRDVVLFAGGLAGVAHETFFATVDRPYLLLLFAGMMGLPVVIGADEWRSRRGTNGGDGRRSTSPSSAPGASSSE